MKLLSRRTMRRFCYYGSKWWWRRLRYPRTLLHLSALDTQPGKTHNGFYIGVLHRKYDTPAFHYFAATITQSLDLIARHDPRRYKTIVRNIKTIAWNPHLSSVGMYHLFRVCLINDKEAFEQRAHNGATADDAETAQEPSLYEIVFLASVLVHEATHGRIQSCFIPYDKRNREATEKLCIKEEERFMNRLYEQGVFPKVTMRPFSADRWKNYWKD